MPNCFEDMPFFTRNVEVMLNDELKPNFAELLRTSVNLSAPTAGWGAEFCSCVESVLAIAHLQLQKGVVTHICQSLCTNSGRCAEFCSCVQFCSPANSFDDWPSSIAKRCSKCMHGMIQTEAENPRHSKRSQTASLSQICPLVGIGDITSYLLRMRRRGQVTWARKL